MNCFNCRSEVFLLHSIYDAVVNFTKASFEAACETHYTYKLEAHLQFKFLKSFKIECEDEPQPVTIYKSSLQRSLQEVVNLLGS